MEMNNYASQIFHAKLKVKILKYNVNLAMESSNRSLFRSLPSCYLSMSPEIQHVSKNKRNLSLFGN